MWVVFRGRGGGGGCVGARSRFSMKAAWFGVTIGNHAIRKKNHVQACGTAMCSVSICALRLGCHSIPYVTEER
jgi:hypothetical protein